MSPRWGNTFLFRSPHKLPRLHLGPLKGFLSWHGVLALCYASGTTKKRKTIMSAALGAEVPRYNQYNWRKPWLGVCWKCTCLHTILDCEKSIELNWVGDIACLPLAPHFLLLLMPTQSDHQHSCCHDGGHCLRFGCLWGCSHTQGQGLKRWHGGQYWRHREQVSPISQFH